MKFHNYNIKHFRRQCNMSLEAILTEIRDELKESNRLKKQQTDSFKDFSKSAEEIEVPFEKTTIDNQTLINSDMGSVPTETDTEETGQSEQVEEIDEATFKKAIAKVIKGGTPEQKKFAKEQIKLSGASKVSDVPANKRKEIIDALEAQ